MMSTRLQYNKGSYVLTIPKEVVRLLDWRKGDEILFEPNGKTVILRKLEFRRALDQFFDIGRIKQVYTIGYEGKNIDEFIDELLENGVERLVDVRELPLSRKNGFSKNSLRKALADAGIEYKPFPELGSPKEIRDDLRSKLLSFGEFAELYRKYLQTRIDDIKALELYVSSKKSVLMCFEADWRCCHRSIISEFLEEDGFEVIHL